MAGKDELARAAIAQRAGERLASDDLAAADRQAAEALARMLAADAIERVRRALSMAVRHARHLPRDIAMKIAHDIDSVACPFLEVTEVFSESDWQQLVLTISRSALVAVARRKQMHKSLASALAEIGDLPVAHALVDNASAPMTERVCAALMDRFGAETALLDRMAQRQDLVAEIVMKLTAKVAGAAREKLLRRYNMPDHTEMLGAEAESIAVIGVIRQTPSTGLAALIRTMRREGKLTDLLLLNAARHDLIAFLAAALSDRTTMRMEQVTTVLLHAGAAAVVKLLKQARVPQTLHDDFWTALAAARGRLQGMMH
ncbi:MAG: DUF2336 domain-containing protein [Alphaproteobacteria bacterium]|nr:DUF2336 domain-containing protein [Alphaproteobacteria bacterium]